MTQRLEYILRIGITYISTNRIAIIFMLLLMVLFFVKSETLRGRFQFIVILTPVVVICLGKKLAFKSVIAHCDVLLHTCPFIIPTSLLPLFQVCYKP